MGIGKYFYWALWLPVFITGIIALIVFRFSMFIGFCNAIVKELHNEIKEF